MNWINPDEQKPKKHLKVLIAAPNYTAIGYWDGESWGRWIDFPRNGKPFTGEKLDKVFAWQPLPNWEHADFNWL